MKKVSRRAIICSYLVPLRLRDDGVEDRANQEAKQKTTQMSYVWSVLASKLVGLLALTKVIDIRDETDGDTDCKLDDHENELQGQV